MQIRTGRSFEDNSFRTPRKRPVVGVMGGSVVQDPSLPKALGAWLALTGWDLLTGAGKGTMLQVSRAFAEHAGRRGLVIGIVPGQLRDEEPVYETRSKSYPNPYVEVAIFTHLPTRDDLEGLGSRNPVNILTSDAIVLLPGGRGTLAEAHLARRLQKPAIAYLGAAGRIGELGAQALKGELGETIPVTRSFRVVMAFLTDVMARLGYPAVE